MNPIIKKTIFAAFTVLMATFALELSLQALAWVSPTVEFHLAPPGSIKVIDDPHLGWRPHPGLPEHDRNGFRNRFVPKQAAIVALGDSQTYGYSVNARNPWPQQLAQLSGVSTYNMAYGGYSPVHSLLLWNEAMQHQPEVIIEAFYAGNDLYDAFNLVYYKNQLPGLKSTQQSIIDAIYEAENEEPLKKTIADVYWRGQRQPDAQPISLTFSHLVRKHCRIYGLLRAVKNAAKRRFGNQAKKPNQTDSDWNAHQQFAQENQDYFMAFNDGSSKTLLSHLCRSYTANLDDPRIAEGHRIVLRANRTMARRAKERGVRFIVLMIPSKELTFKDAVRRSGVIAPQTYHQTVRREERMWRVTKQYFEEHQIEYIDTLPQLKQMLNEGQQPFHMSDDTHLNAAGHKIIAQLVHVHTPSADSKLAQSPAQSPTQP